MNKETKIKSLITDFGDERYKEGFDRGIVVAETIASYLTMESDDHVDIYLATLHRWAINLINKEKSRFPGAPHP